MKVLVTGASGFLGHAVCAELRDARPRGGRARSPTRVGAAGDLRGAAATWPKPMRSAGVLEDVRPDCVIHLAAEIASQRDPRRIARGERRGHPPAARGLRRRRTGRASCSPRPSSPATPAGAELDEDSRAPGRDRLRALQAGGRAARARLGARQRDHPPEPRLRAGRLVRGGVRQAAQAAGALRGDRLGRQLVGRRARRGRRRRPASTPPSEPRRAPSITSSTTSRSATTTSSR